MQYQQASPGPMTLDMGSLFSGARRVKGGKPRGGISGSSAQPAGDVLVQNQASHMVSPRRSAHQLGDDNVKEPEGTKSRSQADPAQAEDAPVGQTTATQPVSLSKDFISSCRSALLTRPQVS